MSISINIHPKTYGEDTVMTTSREGVSWDNANAVCLSFDDKDFTVFHLDDVTAELLHLVASKSVDEREQILAAAKSIDTPDAVAAEEAA